MSLGAVNCKTKKEYKEKALNKPVHSYAIETSIFGTEGVPNSSTVVVGPCAYTSRKWCASIKINAEGIVTNIS